MFWNKKTIELYRDAAEYCKFHQSLVTHITPLLKSTDSLLDIGCGHAYIDLLLAGHVKKISCVDIDDAVLAELKKRQPANMTVINSDFSTLQIDAHDYVIMSFYGRLTEDYQKIKRFAKKGIITIKNIKRTVIEFNDQVQLTRETHGDVVNFCQQNNIVYQSEILELPFGQPFKTIDDVYLYLKRYKPIKSGNYEDYLKENLVAIDDPNYSYYLPKLKRVGIAIIDTSTGE